MHYEQVNCISGSCQLETSANKPHLSSVCMNLLCYCISVHPICMHLAYCGLLVHYLLFLFPLYAEPSDAEHYRGDSDTRDLYLTIYVPRTLVPFFLSHLSTSTEVRSFFIPPFMYINLSYLTASSFLGTINTNI